MHIVQGWKDCECFRYDISSVQLSGLIKLTLQALSLWPFLMQSTLFVAAIVNYWLARRMVMCSVVRGVEHTWAICQLTWQVNLTVQILPITLSWKGYTISLCTTTRKSQSTPNCTSKRMTCSGYQTERTFRRHVSPWWPFTGYAIECWGNTWCSSTWNI